MNVHGNAKLGLAGRRALVARFEDPEQRVSFREAAASFGVSPATAHKWWKRWQQASEPERSSLACLCDRSSRPHRSPRCLPDAEQRRICAARRRSGWGPRLIAGETGHPHSTVWKVLNRHGLSRRPALAREAANRYEWPCPGDLLHMDVARYARFRRPGHRVTGDRSHGSRNWMRPETRVGYDYAHAIVDDHSRLAYVELHPDEKATTVTAFTHRALGFFESHGITPRRLMTDG